MFVTKSPGLYNEIICKPFILLAGSQKFTCLMQDELYRFGFPFIKYNIIFVSQPCQRKYLKRRSDGVTCNVTYSVNYLPCMISKMVHEQDLLQNFINLFKQHRSVFLASK